MRAHTHKDTHTNKKIGAGASTGGSGGGSGFDHLEGPPWPIGLITVCTGSWTGPDLPALSESAQGLVALGIRLDPVQPGPDRAGPGPEALTTLVCMLADVVDTATAAGGSAAGPGPEPAAGGARPATLHVRVNLVRACGARGPAESAAGWPGSAGQILWAPAAAEALVCIRGSLATPLSHPSISRVTTYDQLAARSLDRPFDKLKGGEGDRGGKGGGEEEEGLPPPFGGGGGSLGKGGLGAHWRQ